MNLGPTRSRSPSPTMAASRTRLTRPPPRRAPRRPLEPHRARRLDQHDVARARSSARTSDRPVASRVERARRPRTRGRAVRRPTTTRSTPSVARGGARPRGGSAPLGAELGHLAEHRDVRRPAARSTRCWSAARIETRVCVLGVVDQQRRRPEAAAPRPAQPRELDLQLAVRHLDARARRRRAGRRAGSRWWRTRPSEFVAHAHGPVADSERHRDSSTAAKRRTSTSSRRRTLQRSGRRRHDRRSRRRQRVDELGLRPRDVLERPDQLEVRRPDVRDRPRRAGARSRQSSAIWPRPRIAISTMQISVSGSRRPSVSGTPSSSL